MRRTLDKRAESNLRTVSELTQRKNSQKPMKKNRSGHPQRESTGKSTRRLITADSNRVIRLEELEEDQLEVYAQNYQLVCLQLNGKSAREAINHLCINISERWARELLWRYQTYGAGGLIDRRWLQQTKRTKFTSEVQKIVLMWWCARPAAGPKAIWEKVIEWCRKRRLPEPGYDLVKKYLASLPEVYKLFRGGKVQVWDKQGRPVVRFEMAICANHRWQIDNSALPIWIKEKVNGSWEPFSVWISALLDTYSRAIPGFVLSTKTPDAWNTALLLRKAILPKEQEGWIVCGIPGVLQPDRGGDFMAKSVVASLGYLGILHDPDPPRYPNRKGKLERWFETLDTGCLRILPGHKSVVGVSLTSARKRVHEFLTRSQLKREI